SGGLDSSSIVCMLKEMEPAKKYTTVSMCWDNEEVDEQRYIDPVLEKTKFCGKKLFPDINELNRCDTLDKIIYHQDQPMSSASHFAEYKLHQGASREGFTVMLDGQGSDEYLGGYGIFNFYNMLGLIGSRQWKDARSEWSALKKFLEFSDWRLMKFLLYIKYMQPLPLMDSVIRYNWGRDFLAKNPFTLPKGARADMKNFSFLQLFVSSLPFQLHSADRNSMSHSIESRLPFLDHRLVEFTFRLPDQFKINKGVSKAVLREAMKSILPEEVRTRKHKLGLPAPEREWMHANAGWVEKELTESACVMDKIIDIAALKKRFESFRRLKYADHSLFFRTICFSRWARIFNVSLSQLFLYGSYS
ncbi:MAG TPA: asparagine synthase C-terminal domain-containing protein, partial [Chitinophagaceae bacterium]|nr:asparagine synthase C-terminal domain-containing protein [Chitinophagaceae bacterium]